MLGSVSRSSRDFGQHLQRVFLVGPILEGEVEQQLILSEKKCIIIILYKKISEIQPNGKYGTMEDRKVLCSQFICMSLNRLMHKLT